ncbi:ribonuclease H [Sesbania bispinosa]|nr:ribonuclease H [Sesbania bispinosa]
METSQNTAAAQEPAGSNHATTTNPTEKEGDKSAKEDMFGDWVVVSKSKKPTKSRSKIQGAEKEGTKVNQGDCQRDIPKIWTKKKRPRKELPLPPLPKVVPDANYAKVMERLGDVFKRGTATVLSAPLTKGSYVWRSILKARNDLLNGFGLQLGDGEASFWYDPWLSSEPLCANVPFVDVHDLRLRVRDVWHDESWHLADLWTILPPPVKDSILQLRPFLNSSTTDNFVWKGAMTGTYTAKSGGW